MITAARILIILTLLFAPWAFGSVEPWSQRTLQVLVGATWVLVVAHSLINRQMKSAESLQKWTWSVPFIALAGYVIVQAVNPSFRYQVADGSLLPQPHLAWLPHSVDPAATWESLAMLLTYGAFFWTVRQAFEDPASARLLIAILVVSGFVMALVMIGHKYSGDGKLLWIRNSRVGSANAGPFVNRNNYAAYVNLVIPMALALGTYCRSLHPQRNTRPTASESDPSYLIYFMAAVMAGSVFLSGSRAGTIICSGLAGAWGIKAVSAFVWRRRQSRSLSLVRLLVPFSLGVLLLAAVLASLGVEHIAAQTARTQTAFSELTTHGGRMDGYRGTLAMFSDHWLYGSGAGAFSSLFPFYQPAGVPGWWRYAHSDWLQWLAELGVVGSILAMTVLLASLRFFVVSGQRSVVSGQPLVVGGGHPVLRTHLPSPISSFPLSAFRFPLFLAVCGVALHAGVDFPLHIPAVAITAVAFLALLTVSRQQSAVSGP